MTQKKVTPKKTSKAVVVSNKQAFSKGQVELITRTVARGATADELALFLNVCKRAGLDPFLHQIHLVGRKTKQPDGSYKTVRTVQVGIDGYRAIAERTKQLAGVDDAIFDDGYKYEPGKEPKNPSKATVTIYRIVNGERVAFTSSARWKEYYPGGAQAYMWDKMPYNQLAKCAEALSLRKAFPTDLSGLYTDAEMDQSGVIDADVVEDTNKKNVKSAMHKSVQSEVVSVIVKDEKFVCQGCDVEITKAESDYSTKMYGKPYCRECQKQFKK